MITARRPRGTRTQLHPITAAVITVLLALTGITSLHAGAASAAPTGGTTALTVQVDGVFADAPGQRTPTVGTVVGTVTTTDLGFVAGTSPTSSQTFQYTVICAQADGTACPDGTTLTWNFGDDSPTQNSTIDSTASNPADRGLSADHNYTKPGAYTLRVTANDASTTSPGYGAGAITALVSPRYADVDATATGGQVNPVATAVWAVSALGLMPSCQSYYSANSALTIAGAAAEAPGRALFCPNSGADAVTTSGGTLTHAATNPIPAGGPTDDSSDCLAVATNCGLPTSAFDAGTDNNGDPLAACDDACRTALADRHLLTSAAPGADMVYSPTNCADNTVAVYSQTTPSTLTTTRGVEPGCENRGDFLRALLKAVDGADTTTLAGGDGSLALDTQTCPSGPTPDPAGRDGLRRAAALLSNSDAAVSPCNPDAALTKGEAYQMLAAVLTPTSSQANVTLADLPDQHLGYGDSTAPYPYDAAARIRGVLAAGAPLIGSSRCPVTPASGPAACFNPYEPVTRAGAAQLLAYFILGSTPNIAAVTATLTADSMQVPLGGTDLLHLNVAVPTWLRPYSFEWTFGVDSSVPDGTVTFSCPTDGWHTQRVSTWTLTCPIQVNKYPAGGTLPLTATIDGNTYQLPVAVVNNPPTVVTATVPALTEDQTAATGTVTWTDPENNPLSALQVAATADGTWDDQVSAGGLTVAVGTVNNNTGTGALTLTPQPDRNGTATFYVRACDIGNACSAPKQVTASIAAVNDAPVAYPITRVQRDDNVVTVSGDCRTAQSGTLPADAFTLVGSDAADDGQGGYTSTITAYTVTVPADAAGTLYMCADSGTWTPVTAGASSSSTYPVVLWNPTVGQYGTWTFSYTVTDAGYPAPGLTSAPAPITASNISPNILPTALLTVTPTDPVAGVTDVTFDGSESNVNGNPSGIVSYAFDFGDGTSSGTVPAPTITHRYAAAGTYTAKLTVTATSGRTATTSATVSVAANMVTNATFESAGTTGWSGDGILAAATDGPHAGTGYLQVAPVLSCTPGDACDTGGQGDCSTSPLPAGCVYTADAATSTTATTTAGQAYHAAVWLKPAAQTTGQQATVTLTEQSATGTVLGTASTQATLGPADVWQAAGLDYTATGDGSTLTLTVSTPATSTTSAAFGLDDIALSKTS